MGQRQLWVQILFSPPRLVQEDPVEEAQEDAQLPKKHPQKAANL